MAFGFFFIVFGFSHPALSLDCATFGKLACLLLVFTKNESFFACCSNMGVHVFHVFNVSFVVIHSFVHYCLLICS